MMALGSAAGGSGENAITNLKIMSQYTSQCGIYDRNRDDCLKIRNKTRSRAVTTDELIIIDVQ